MASGVYTNFIVQCMKKIIDCDADTFKCALMDNVHAYNVDNDVWADISANEISGTGYSSPGKDMTNPAATADDTDNEAVFDADDVSWTSASFTAYHAVVYDDTPTSPADPLVCSIDFGGAQTVTSGTFTIQWDAEGIVNIAPA